MVQIVELSSTEEKSDNTVPKKNANPEESKSPTNAKSPQADSDKSPASDSGKNAKEKSARKSGIFGKSKSKKTGQSPKDKAAKKASKDESMEASNNAQHAKDTSKLNTNSTKAEDNQASNASETKPESSKTDSDAAKPKLTEGEASKVKDSDSPRESGGSDKDVSPKSNPDEPVLDNSPVSSDNEWSPGSFTVTSAALYHENDQGKELFVKGDYDAAIQRWSKSIDNLTTVLDRARNNPDHDITEDALHEFTKMYVILCSNLALAHIKKGAYEKCKEYCQYVLMYDDRSLKAHLRIVQADVHLRNFEQALRNCNKGLEFHPENHELLALRATINAELKRYEGVEKLFCQNAFKRIEVDPRSEQVHPPSEDDQPSASEGDQPSASEGDQPPASEEARPPPPGDLDSSSRAYLFMVYHKVHLVLKQAFLTLSRVFRTTRSRVQHSYALVTRPLAWFLKKAKLL